MWVAVLEVILTAELAADVAMRPVEGNNIGGPTLGCQTSASSTKRMPRGQGSAGRRAHALRIFSLPGIRIVATGVFGLSRNIWINLRWDVVCIDRRLNVPKSSAIRGGVSLFC